MKENKNYCVYRHKSFDDRVYIGITCKALIVDGVTDKDIMAIIISPILFANMVGIQWSIKFCIQIYHKKKPKKRK